MKLYKTKYRTVEVDRVTRPDGVQPSREEWRALAANPIFQHLLGRLRAQNGMLRARLQARFDDLKDLAYVQSGVFWTGWLAQDIAKLTAEPPKPELPPLMAEVEEFKKIASLLEAAGIDPQDEVI